MQRRKWFGQPGLRTKRFIIVYIVIYLCYCMKTDRICGMHGGNNGGKFAVNELERLNVSFYDHSKNTGADGRG